ncbi:MAG: ABC transporter ATP-binding protein [Dehalococcoidia bacterium]|nr:ABC transporter ATP-binding protein [Dehalococcoidia bacterium]MDH5781141.1 ABC transporter ATP-binding protein [Dehalococcoidia bacterium]
MPLLKVEKLTKRFGGLIANKDISFEILRGQIVGLIGPNGAGKTTLFNVITGFHKANEGKVLFNGRDITNLSPHAICKKGIVRTFQIVKIFDEMTVLENIMVGAFNRYNSSDVAKKKALEAFELIQLGVDPETKISALTFAAQRKLELARTLVTGPELLLLDEMMAGLNLTEIKEATDLLRKIRDSGITLFIVEHVMEAIMPLADRVIVLHFGEKIADGKPSEVAINEAVIEAYLGEEYA